jgi:hypothetical protein
MPFDSAEFFRDPPAAPPIRVVGWAARLRRAFQAFRAPCPAVAPLDPAVVRVLEEARGLIEQRRDWVQGRYETVGGERCAIGAVRIATELFDYAEAGARAERLLARVASRRGFTSVEAMNDRSPHGHVLSAFDEAIATARFEERG